MTARAILLQTEPLDLAKVDDFVNAWVGTPFAWDGRSAAGVDCWGLVWLFHRDCLGAILPDWHKGARGLAWVFRTIAGEYQNHWHALAAPEPGCIVLSMPGARPAHVGIFWRGGVLHAEESVGVQWNPLPIFALAHPGHEFGRYALEGPPDAA